MTTSLPRQLHPFPIGHRFGDELPEDAPEEARRAPSLAEEREYDAMNRAIATTCMQEWQRQWDEGIAEAEREIAEHGCPF